MPGQSSDRCILPEARRKPRDRACGDSSGSGKAAGEDRRDEPDPQTRKGDEVDQFAFSEKPVHHRPRRLGAWLNLTGATRGHSAVTLFSHLKAVSS
jgi:hypothetical protein